VESYFSWYLNCGNWTWQIKNAYRDLVNFKNFKHVVMQVPARAGAGSEPGTNSCKAPVPPHYYMQDHTKVTVEIPVGEHR
jgi:hypothetical protein